RGRVFGFHLLPVAVELLGDKLRKTGQGPLTHFRPRNADHDIIWPDEDPRTHLTALVAEPLLRERISHGGQVEAERQAAPSGRTGDQKSTPIDDLAWSVPANHSASPQAFLPLPKAACGLPAARCTAARIRWYVPQRQTFVMASSTSASVGLGFF